MTDNYKNNYTALMVICIFVAMSTAYLCHHNTFVIYNSLKKRTTKRFMITTHISVGVAMVMFIVLGGLGYVTFVQSVDGQ